MLLWCFILLVTQSQSMVVLIWFHPVMKPISSLGVYFRRLVDIVDQFRQPNQSCIFLLDCCHAGGMPIEQASLGLSGLQSIVAASSGITLIAASEEDKSASETEKLEHGIFTYWLLQGLEGEAANKEGMVTIASLQEYISTTMMQRGYTQKVVYKTTSIGVLPILANGLVPKGEKSAEILSEEQLQDIEHETQSVLGRLEEQTRVNHNTWIATNYRDVSRDLSSLVTWRDGLRAHHPELKSNNDFVHYDGEIMRFQVKLAQLEPGTNITGGIIKSEIGSGGFGTVYEVNTLAGTKAYKVYHANQLHERDKVKAFLRGHGAMLELKGHPNIVQVGEKTIAPLGFYMDYIQGANLRSWWYEDNEKLLNVLHIIAQTLNFAHSHARRIVHRDVKPENILIAENSEGQPIPYLTDFDLSWYSMSTVYSSIGQSAVAAFGHYLYAAPEQYERPGAEITRKPTTDVYGFGQLCYFVLTGNDPATLAEHSIESLKARLEKWSSEAAAKTYLDLYKKCIQRSPSERYQSMDEVSDIILRVKSLLIDPDQNKHLSKEQFISELTFAMFGFDREPGSSFTSKSGRTSVDLTKIDEKSIHIRVAVIVGFLAMTGTFEQQRNNVNRRIDDALGSLSIHGIDAVRHTEKVNDVFNCTIQIGGDFLTMEGTGKIRELLVAVIKAVEN